MGAKTRVGGLELIDLTPLYVITFEEGWSPRDLFGVQKAILARGAPRVLFIVEVLHIRPAEALERRALSDALKGAQVHLDPRTIASIVVTDSAVMRGVIRAVTWFHAIPYPLCTVSSLEEARDTAAEYLRGEGLELSSDARVEIGGLARSRQQRAATRA
jgi:hypothetical protein